MHVILQLPIFTTFIFFALVTYDFLELKHALFKGFAYRFVTFIMTENFLFFNIPFLNFPNTMI